MFTRVRGGCVIHRSQNKNSQLGNRTGRGEWRPTRKRWGFGGFEKSSELSSYVRTGKLTFGARRGQTSSLQMGCRMWFGADVKAVSIERLCVSLSSCRITFNSKVIKFRTGTNFLNVVYFGFPMSISHIRILWVYYTYMYIHLANKLPMLNWIVNMKCLKPSNCVQTNELWFV